MNTKNRRQNSERKVFIIGLDGATYSVLRPLVERGKLPVLASLMQTGAHGELCSTIPPLTAPAWASFITGKNPGKHGVFQFGNVDQRLYQDRAPRIVNSRTLRGAKLWEIIGKAGKTVGIINVPLTYPPQPVNGFMITGMLTPRESDHFTYPPDLAASLDDYIIDLSVRDGEYGVLDDMNTQDREVLKEFVEDLNKLVKMRTRKAQQLIRMNSPDFFMLLFTETDRLQHILWPYVKATDRGKGTKHERELRSAVENFFSNLDENIGELLEAAGETTAKIIMSDHGFGSATKKNVNLNMWLRDRGYLQLRKNPRTVLNPKKWLHRVGLDKETLYAAMNTFFPAHTVRKMQRTWTKVVHTPIDWDESRAVFIPLFEFVGGIQILSPPVEGKYEDRPHLDYEEFRESLIQQLLELRDPQTDRTIVREVYRREQLYEGECTHEAPDIIFVMASEYRGEKGLLGKSLVSEKVENINLWSGTHRREGILILNGPQFSSMRLTSAPQIQDLPPTILYLLGIAIPEDMDGQVIQQAFESSYLSRNTIRYAKPMSPSENGERAETDAYSDDELEKVREHLENLGYLS